MSKNYSEMAIEMLRATRDGETLAPVDLKLLEMAVNGFLNEAGDVAFCDLYARVSSGEYCPPWFHGIEHLTRNHEGYVFWKGFEVEHYSGTSVYSEDGRQAAIELARRCRHLEAIGETPNCTKAIWRWEQYESKVPA